ncbi:lipid-A-disaccharide synthase [Rubidibacter lacunae KORDI 51-2]|uniref:Lipid-A-disaccharide synthase n=1 Tax=Rubidibacter lacunae KORDI 51-2 TaxID=582515 RepID=U5DKX8_9CHRO|nr:lipid-A-disaccharide synthase [Rubidibacter lacunae]ERN42341.1 lipid-A-disaccharide synthase [Rubidibacter lacunae KORDI 51-2]
MQTNATGQSYSLFISTGEVSGDLQGALLVAALRRLAAARNLALEIVALGGDCMAAAGATLLGNTTRIGSVGLLESLPFVVPTWLIQRRAKQWLRAQPPDAMVAIDYCGPNLSLAEFARHWLPQIPRIYYIAPQAYVWAMPGTTRQLLSVMDRHLAIFPEEARFFRDRGIETTWVGHPIADRLQSAPSRGAARATLGIAQETRAVVLLPASRRQELKYLLPPIFEAARQLQERVPQVAYWIPLSMPAFREPIAAAVARYGLQATLVDGQQRLAAISAADLAISKSGTVNLETAYLDVPQVVLYRVSPLTAWIVRKLLNFSIPFMSPPNLVLMEAIVPELLQEEVTPERIAASAERVLLDREYCQQMQAGYARMRAALGGPGASDRAATQILDFIQARRQQTLTATD